jgi:chitodextrinase
VAGLAVAAISTATTTAAATADTQAPTTPTGVRVTSQTQTSVALSWGASTDDDYSHSIQYVVTVGSTTRSTNYSSIVISNLATNHVYDVSVQAKDAAGNVRIATRAVVITGAGAQKQRTAVKRGRAF